MISSLPFRIFILALTVWALGMIVPEVVRPFAPLGTIGLTADNNGRIISVDPAGPAAKQHVTPFHEHRAGDRVDLRGTDRDDLLEVFGGLGGMQYLQVGHSVTLHLLHPDGTPYARPVTLTATVAPLSLQSAIVLELDQVLGIGFVLLALFIVWMYPRRSTFGFFLFAVWFNPGQYFWYYAHLNGPEMIVQEVLQAIFEAAGVVGFLEFALRFPNDRAENWRASVEKFLPLLFCVLAALGIASYGAELGRGSEIVSRLAYATAYAIYPLVVVAFITKLRVLSPQDALRLRWVIAGCIPGLFFFILADSVESTSMWQWLWDALDWSPPESWLNLAYMVNSLVAVSVAYAVIRQRVLPIAFLINRGLVLGTVGIVIASTVEVLVFITHSLLEEHHILSTILTGLMLAVLAPLVERMDERLTELFDRMLFRSFHEAEKRLEVLAATFSAATSIDGIDRNLIEGPVQAFGLASAAIFRETETGTYERGGVAVGWEHARATTLEADDPLVLCARRDAQPLRLNAVLRNNSDFPAGAGAPAIILPLNVDRRVPAIVMYGGHPSGTDLSPDEIACLTAVAAAGASARERVRTQHLAEQLSALRQQLNTMKVATAS